MKFQLLHEIAERLFLGIRKSFFSANSNPITVNQ